MPINSTLQVVTEMLGVATVADKVKSESILLKFFTLFVHILTYQRIEVFSPTMASPIIQSESQSSE